MKRRNEKLIKLMGERFKKLRINQNISQEDVSYSLGLNRISVVNIECGRQGLTPENILKCCILFKCNLQDIFPSESEFTPTLNDYANSEGHQLAVKKKEIWDKIKSLRQEIANLKP